MSSENSKPMVTDVFVKGAIQGWNIATHSTIPNVLMAFVIIAALNVAGLLPILGDIFRPLMGLFGLPGEAAAVLIAGWMSMGGGVGVAAALFDQGAISVGDCAILAPAIYLMGFPIAIHGSLLGRYRYARQDDPVVDVGFHH